LLNHSKRAILETLIEMGPQSRAALAEALGLSRAALSGLSRDLIDAGVLREAELNRDASRLGRPAILLELNASHAYFIGVSIEQPDCVMLLADLHGNILGEGRFPLTRDPEALAREIARAVPPLTEAAGLAAGKIKGKIKGMSVVLSGFVNHAQDTCLNSAILGWRDVPLARLVETASGLPTVLENNANAVAVGEKLFGRGREVSDFSVVTFGEGIGCALYLGGRLYRGHSGGAGEIAHSTIEPGGLPCRCGKRGCLDTIASANAIIGAAREQGLVADTPQQIEDLAKSGDSYAIRVLHRAGNALGLAISHLIQMNNPERVVIASVGGNMGNLLRTVTKQSIDAYVLPELGSMTDIRFDDVERNFWARGAAACAAYRYLTDFADDGVVDAA